MSAWVSMLDCVGQRLRPQAGRLLRRDELYRHALDAAILGGARGRQRREGGTASTGPRRDAEWRPAVESDLRWSRAPQDLSDEEYKRVETWYYWKPKAT
jgi:hypothetical protein